MKTNCISCHFLKSERAGDGIIIMPQKERDQLQENKLPDRNYWLCCVKGVWDDGQTDSLNLREDRIDNTVDTDRSTGCFFYPHKPGMSSETAQMLQKQDAERQQAHHDRTVMKLGIWVAAIGVALTAIISGLSLYHLW